jgi:hypothetical protein
MAARAKSSGTKVRTAAAVQPNKLRRLVKRPDAIVGDPAGLANTPTFDEIAWRKKWDKRLK